MYLKLNRSLLKFIALALVLASLGSFEKATAASTVSTEPQTVNNVEVERYLGKWYEVMRIPNWSQEGCRSTTAEYSLREDGTVGVLNKCLQTKDGVESENIARGQAWIVEGSGGSKLDVSFACLFDWGIDYCIRAFLGDYWILDLGPVNAAGQYSYSLVGSRNRKVGWILSRTPELSAETIDRIFVKFEEQGYSRKDFIAAP